MTRTLTHMQHDPRDAHPNQILDAIARNTERTAQAAATIRTLIVLWFVLSLAAGAMLALLALTAAG